MLRRLTRTVVACSVAALLIATDHVCGAQAAVSEVTANTSGITLDEAIRRAEANEPTFAAAAAERRATALERKDARAGLLPSASLHNQFLFTESNRTHTSLGTAGGSFNTVAGVQESLPVFIANNSVHEYFSQGVVNETVGLAQIGAVRLADANAALASAELEIARRGLVATVVGLYYSVGSGAGKLAIAQRALEEATRFVELTEKREGAREAAHADVLKARLQQRSRERELADANLATGKARLELGVLLFPDPSTNYALASSEAPPLLPERAGVEVAARANNPELRSALASVQAGRATALNAQAGLLPDLALNYTYGIDAPEFARSGGNGARNLGYSASATVDLPVWDWLTTERKVKEARIRGEASKVALSNAQRRELADLSELYAEAEAAREQLGSLDSSLLDARESLRLTNLRYLDGEGTVLEVVDAQGTLIGVENARIDGEIRYELAFAQLQTLTGRL